MPPPHVPTTPVSSRPAFSFLDPNPPKPHQFRLGNLRCLNPQLPLFCHACPVSCLTTPSCSIFKGITQRGSYLYPATGISLDCHRVHLKFLQRERGDSPTGNSRVVVLCLRANFMCSLPQSDAADRLEVVSWQTHFPNRSAPCTASTETTCKSTCR